MVEPPFLAITETALERVRGFLAGQAEERALSVRVTGTAAGEYVHALSLESVGRIAPDAVVQHVGDLMIVAAADSADKLRGATIDWSDGPQGGGFVVVNPNRPAPATPVLPVLPMASEAGSPGSPRLAPASGPDSDLARRVTAVLERDVNPSIASHGGRAELAGIEGTTAYLRLGGGCQGCGMATVTLSQGIEVAITQAVPEIDGVVDVTDHASGSNPYFEPAKK